MRWSRWMLVCLAGAASGCAAHRGGPPSPPTTSASPAARDASRLSLDEIEPRPVLGQPTTQPSEAPPLEALQLYARARAALLSQDGPTAVSLLRQAIEKDPYRFELHLALARAYGTSPAGVNSAIEHLEQAGRLRPDSLEVHYRLGRYHLSRGDADRAIEQLRLAQLTADYATERESAALVDLMLARCLQQKGFDRAALDQYERLLERMEMRLNLRASPELYYILSRPEAIFIQVGELNEKLEQYENALDSYRAAAEREPANFSYQARVVRLLAKLGRGREASDLAAELVSGHRASPDSLKLLDEVYRQLGREDSVPDELGRILKERPGDRAIRFALADALASRGRDAEAERLLAEALRESRSEPSVVLRLFEFYRQRKRTADAARLLVESLAVRPDSLEDLGSAWEKLARGGGGARLRLPMLQALEVSAGARASKLYWIARLADEWDRDALARASLEEASAAEPLFAPAYRQLLEAYLSRADRTQQQRAEAAESLIERARRRGQPALASELSGMLLLSQRKPVQAAEAFGEAIRAGNPAPSLLYARAVALTSAGATTEAESLLWKTIADSPTFEPAYLSLYGLYAEKRAGREMEKVLAMWLAADPFGAAPRLLKARELAQEGRLDAAESALTSLFRESPDDPTVLSSLRSFFAAAGREEQYTALLEEERARRPDNRVLVSELAARYLQRGQAERAVAAVESMRAASAGDVEQLYFVSNLFQQLNRRDKAEEVLAEVLRLEPHNSSANNDLGYMWADEGRNLVQAEAMIRRAVDAEPDNMAYVDSLGWVLYKIGRFEEAQRHLAEAAASADRPDPVVLDHLGDALYRLKRVDEAMKVWRKSLDRLSQLPGEREDFKKLLKQLKQKIAQQESGRPVEVAPAGDGGTQAKN